MDGEKVYVHLMQTIYPVCFISTIMVQSIMLYLIFRHTPKNMEVLKYVLANTSILQLILMIMTYLCQFRMISSSIPVELRCYGVARYLRSVFAFTVHQIFQLILLMSGTSIVVTFYTKYYTLLNLELTKLKMLKIYAFTHIPVVISAVLGIILIVRQSLPAEIQAVYEAKNENVTIYSTIGALSLSTLPSKINFLLVCGSVFIYPFISLYYRSRILRIVNDQMDKSSKTRKRQNRMFVTGLTIQALLPSLFYLPVFTLYVICVTLGKEILFQQFFMYLFSALPATFDPFVTFYFVTPYRRKLIRLFKKRHEIDHNRSVLSVVTN